jgi:low affinity Fe/Cu permease
MFFCCVSGYLFVGCGYMVVAIVDFLVGVLLCLGCNNLPSFNDTYRLILILSLFLQFEYM